MPNLRYLTPFALPLSLLVACGEGQSTPVAKPHAEATPAATKTNFTGQTWGNAQQREVVRGYIEKLMDVTRVVPDTAAKKGGPRGSPGSYAQLAGPDREQMISAIIHGAERFMPQGLKDEEKWALICAEISIESAFRPGVSSPNPADPSKPSVGNLQITLGIWDDIFRQYANIPGLTYYDGKPWDTKATKNEDIANDIWVSITSSLWCITEQGRRGCPDWFGGPDGPCPKTMHTAFLSWVIGGPALKSGGDLAGQKDAYIASISTDLKVLGFDVSLVDAAF